MPNIKDEILIKAVFRNQVGILADPDTVSCWIGTADGQIVSIVLTQITVGNWQRVYVIKQAGDHWIRIEGTGGVKVMQEKKFSVPIPKVAV